MLIAHLQTMVSDTVAATVHSKLIRRPTTSYSGGEWKDDITTRMNEVACM